MNHSRYCLRNIPPKFIIFFFVFLFFSNAKSHAEERQFFYIRVKIKDKASSVRLEIKGGYIIKPAHSKLILERGRLLRRSKIYPTEYGIKIDTREFKVYGIRIKPRRDGTIYIDGVRYRGEIVIIREKEMRLLVLNYVDIEKYLYGVLYHEIPHHWPMEVLKAIAVCARSFAIYRIETMHDKDYDVTGDIYSQVYGGRNSERWRTRMAVDLTRHEVLIYNQSVLPAYYHSMCGGKTENAEEIFGITLPPLRGKRCIYCQKAPHRYWKTMFSYKQIEEKLNNYGIKVKRLSFIIEGNRNSSGRLKNIRIRDAFGVRKIKAYIFRLAMGPNIIKSTNFTINITPRGIIFKGRGWGHGVGLCQWGAFYMAKMGFGYRKILGYYYPKAMVKKFDKL